MTLNWNRSLSAALAMTYILAALMGVGPRGAAVVAIAVILPLACIWFAEDMGGYTGPNALHPITAPSPGIFVCILGWLVLTLPLILVIVSAIAA